MVNKKTPDAFHDRDHDNVHHDDHHDHPDLGETPDMEN